MQKIKDLTLFNFLCNKDLKSRAIKLAIALFFMCLGYINSIFVYIAFSLCAIYIIFEFSMDSIFWVCLIAIFIRAEVFLTYAIMWEMIAVLAIKFVIDIKNKKINYKNWQFITISALFLSLILLLLLPLCKVYSFVDQFGNFALFTLVVLGLLYIKEINFKQFFILLPLACVTLCVGYYIFSIFKLVDFTCYSSSSFGHVGRFDSIYGDPNFTGAVLICAITCWFVAYKKGYINKQLYFIIITMLFVFSIMTISKATLLILGLFAVFVISENIVISIKTKNPKHLLELVYYGISLVVTCIICYQHIDAMYQRIFNPGEGWWSEGDDSGIATLTTGRSDLWIMYLETICSSPQTFLFGYGCGADILWIGAAHSTPIDYVFRFGFLTTFLLVAIFIVAIIPYIKKIKFYNIIPIILITGMFCSLGSTNGKYVYAFVISFITLCCNGIEHKYQNSKQSNETK